MRSLLILPLAAAAALLPVGAASGQSGNPAFARCDAGLMRNIEVCNRFNETGSGTWNACLDASVLTYRQCIGEVIERMNTVEP